MLVLIDQKTKHRRKGKKKKLRETEKKKRHEEKLKSLNAINPKDNSLWGPRLTLETDRWTNMVVTRLRVAKRKTNENNASAPAPKNRVSFINFEAGRG